MIKKTVSEHEFVDELVNDEYGGWSYAGARALYDYLEQLSDDIGKDIELDRVALRCDYSEYESAWEAMEQYQRDDMPTVDNSEGMDLLEIEEAQQALALEWLQERTTVIEFTGRKTVENGHGGIMGTEYNGVIIQNF